MLRLGSAPPWLKEGTRSSLRAVGSPRWDMGCQTQRGARGGVRERPQASPAKPSQCAGPGPIERRRGFAQSLIERNQSMVKGAEAKSKAEQRGGRAGRQLRCLSTMNGAVSPGPCSSCNKQGRGEEGEDDVGS